MAGTVITNLGIKLIAKLIASGSVLTFTRAAVGVGTVPGGYDVANMTGLNAYKMDAEIAACSAENDTASIVMQINSIGIDSGFTITEAGLFAQDPDIGEILYAYLDLSEDPQYLYARGNAISKFVEMTLIVVIGQVEKVSAYIAPTSLVLKKDFDDMKKDYENHRKDSEIHIKNSERIDWNTDATHEKSGRMSAEDKTKLDGIAQNANNYSHPDTHPATIITETHERKFVSVEQWNKLNALPNNAQMTTRLIKNGWYQILAIESENQETVNGAGGFSAILQIATNFSHNNNISIIVACTLAHNIRDIQVISKAGSAAAATAYPALRWARYANEQVLEFNYTGDEGGNMVHVVPLQWATYEWQTVKLKNLVLSNTTPTSVLYTVDLTKKAGVLELKEEISKQYLPVTASCNKNWNWVGQTGQPTWLWGGIDAANMYVYNPSNFNVDMVDGKHAADLLNYNNLTNKPSMFPPATHTHDDRYYTEAEVNNLLAGKAATNHTHTLSNLPAGLSTGYVTTGQQAGTTLGANATAEGFHTTASGSHSHAEGKDTTASGYESHAEGYGTTASGYESHAEGLNTVAEGACAHASGEGTIADSRQFVIGLYNKAIPFNYDSESPLFIIGNGDIINQTRSNAFRVDANGIVYSTGAYKTSGADYAEYFEWLDKNKENEDRVGYFVTAKSNKIKIANKGDYILGIVSATPSVVGNSYDDQWSGMYVLDKWGRQIYEEHKTKEVKDKNGVIIQEAGKQVLPKINPDYDKNTEYIGRSSRPEWAAIGMLGQLLVRDDGSCKVDGYCKCGAGGIATAAASGYRVLERIDENIVRILFR